MEPRRKNTCLFFAFIVLALCSLIPPVQSQRCSPGNVQLNSTTYHHCTELTALNASLHYTYNQSNSTLSLAFVAAPAKPDDGVTTVFATVSLPGDQNADNHVIKMENLNSNGKKSRNQLRKIRNVHGILSAVGWGILIPISVIMGKFQPKEIYSWNYAQGFFQFSGYVIGVTGWATGMMMQGNDVSDTVHRNIGIAIFSLATANIFIGFIFSCLVRVKEDSFWVKLGWYFFHSEVGFAVAILSIVDVFKGIGMMGPAGDKWRTAYIVFVSVWGTMYVGVQLCCRPRIKDGIDDPCNRV